MMEQALRIATWAAAAILAGGLAVTLAGRPADIALHAGLKIDSVCVQPFPISTSPPGGLARMRFACRRCGLAKRGETASSATPKVRQKRTAFSIPNDSIKPRTGGAPYGISPRPQPEPSG